MTISGNTGFLFQNEPIKRAVFEILGLNDCEDTWGNNCFIVKIVDGKFIKYN